MPINLETLARLRRDVLVGSLAIPLATFVLAGRTWGTASEWMLAQSIPQREYYPSHTAAAWLSIIGTFVSIAAAFLFARMCRSLILRVENELRLYFAELLAATNASDETKLCLIAKAPDKSEQACIVKKWNRRTSLAINCNLIAMMISSAGIPGIIAAITDPNNKSVMFLTSQPPTMGCIIIACLALGCVAWHIESNVFDSLIRNLENGKQKR